EPVLEELSDLERALVAGDDAAGDLGRGARDVRDVHVGEVDALRFGGALHDLRGVPRGTRRVTAAVRVTERAVDGDRRVPRVDLVTRGVARERARDVADVVDRQALEGGVELRQIHARHSRHNSTPSWGISEVNSRNCW